MINRALVLSVWNSLRQKTIELGEDKKERKRLVGCLLDNSLSDLKDAAKAVREVIDVMPNFSKGYVVITVREKIDSTIGWINRSNGIVLSDSNFGAEEID